MKLHVAHPGFLVFLALLAGTGCERRQSATPIRPIPSEPEILPANRLSGEKSPYLLQHARNPVDWYPWGDEAFERAKRENRPVFLSVGYSSCHWCHVMEKETFSNPLIAKFLNDHFICIKVDREERPDVDAIYMAYLQASTGDAGWPMSVFLTPHGHPFFGGTYYPPERIGERPGFLELAKRMHGLWTTQQEHVLMSAGNAATQIRHELASQSTDGSAPAPESLRDIVLRIRQSHDPVHGGFGDGPKFPESSLLSFLLFVGMREDDKELVKIVRTTCDHMAAGAIHDHLGGGFSRYTVDAQWRVPHFEKMLYDNAQLLDLYLDLYLVIGDEQYADVARGIADYVLRDLTGPDGEFHCSEDAQSEGLEGKYYLWTWDELDQLLPTDQFALVCRHYGITSSGNFPGGGNVLAAIGPELSAADRILLESAKHKMAERRMSRIRPQRDDKVLSSWNGLMLGALARAAVVLGRPEYHAAAERNLRFLQTNLWDAESNTLHHCWRMGRRDNIQLLDAYAFLLDAVIDLYETTLDPVQLRFAIDLADAMKKRFEDRENGGFWGTDTKDKNLIVRPKEMSDSPLPSGTALATIALLKLAVITGREDFSMAAHRALASGAREMARNPRGSASMLMAHAHEVAEPCVVTLVGEREHPQLRELIRTIHTIYQPCKVVMGIDGTNQLRAGSIHDYDDARAIICVGKSCKLPTADALKIREYLTEGWRK